MFTLPPGYKVWCHRCGEPPFNKITQVTRDAHRLSDRVLIIPGVGFKTEEEWKEHKRIYHEWKG